MKKIIILIPVFNDWESLKKLLIEIENSIKKFPDLTIQCFVINDASTIAKPEFKKPEKIDSLKIDWERRSTRTTPHNTHNTHNKKSTLAPIYF